MRSLVRSEFSEEATWRDVLGDSELLLCFATFGAIDAPEYSPAGSMRSSNFGPLQTYAHNLESTS